MNFFKRKPKVTLEGEKFKTLKLLDELPINVTIRRIKPKQGGNKWSAQYLDETLYYGKTLQEALHKLVTRSKKVAKKIEKNKNYLSGFGGGDE